MAHQSHIKSEKCMQWVKAVLGLGYLKEGLAPFCEEISKQQHLDILDNIKRVKNVQSVICGTCTLKTLQPDHVKIGNKQCPLRHPNCNCCYTAGKRPCPNNVCGAIYDNIITNHASTPPAPYWKNTQTQQWIADPWSIAKCFINAPGYEQKTSAADTDCKGLFDLIINNKYFHNHVSCNMTGPTIFSKVRKYKNEIFHSSTMELDSQQANSYIDDMIAVLQDDKELIHRKDAQEAVKKLKDLKNVDLCITTKDVEHALGNIKEEIGFFMNETEAHNEDREDMKLNVASLNTSISELKEAVLALKSSLQNPDPNLTQRIDEIIDKHLDHEALDKYTQKRIPIEVEGFRTYYENLCNKVEELCEFKLEIFQEKMASQKGIPWTHDEYPQAKTRSESEWTLCIENKDEEKAYQLLEIGQLPDAGLLEKACKTFGLKSSILKAICTNIEEKITATSDCIINTNACYKETEKDKIVFVVITRGATDYVDLSKDKYNVLVRSIDYCSQEGRMIIEKERGLRFKDSEMEDIEVILKDRSPDLMAKHSNLTLTSGTMFKSKNQSAAEMSLERKVCIVFYVTVKGLIPVGEDLLPNKLGKFDTDVREGRFLLAVGGQPGVKHKNLKLGCQISCEAKIGTVGGFVYHRQHGVCAITCAHVVSSEEEVIALIKKGNENRDICIGKKCYQPKYSKHVENKCGTVVEVHMLNGDVDAALVKIDDDRIPTNGHFPDCDLSDIKGGCTHCKDDIVRKTPSFKKGTVLDTDEITTNNSVVKYGQKTKFTIGTIKVKGGSVKFETSPYKRCTLTLHNLMEIHSMDPPFSEAGDSGALVFTQDDNNKLAAIGLLVGINKNTDVSMAQPICSVLERVGCKRPFSLMNFDPHERRIETSLKKISEKLGIE